jgi:hypothetical protein
MRRVLVVVALLAMCALGSWAQLVDPPLWTVSGTGTANQFAGQNFLLSGPPEVNKLGSGNEAGLYIQGGSPNKTNFNPFYLILGFVNTASPSAPTITNVSVYNNAGTPNGTGIINAGTPSSTTSTSISASSISSPWTGTPNDVYSFLGSTFAGGNNSENFTNWVAAEAALGITATKFTIGVYDLSSFTNNSSFTGNGLVDMTFSSALPTGTMVIGFGCGPANCQSNPNPFSNAFTQSGIVNGTGGTGGQTSGTGGQTSGTGGQTSGTGGQTSGTGATVPEPSALILFGTVAILVGALKRKTGLTVKI